MSKANKVKFKFKKPHRHQITLLKSTARTVTVMAGRRFGKTEAMYILSILYASTGKTVFFVCPTFGQCRDWFVSLLNQIPSELIADRNKSDLRIDLINGGSIKFFSGQPDAIERMRGYEAHLVIVDEFCNITQQNYVYYDIIKPLVAITGGRIFLISTPKGTGNFFYQCFLKGKRKDEGFESFKFKSIDNPFFPIEEYNELKRNTPEITFLQEYDCDPQANQSNPFQDKDVDRNTIKTLSTEPTVVYGIDIAKGATANSDATCIIGLSATGKQTYFERFRINDYEIQYQKILNLPYPNALKVIDSSSFSAGGVIYERIRSVAGQNVIGFEFTSKSKAPMIFKLVNAVEKDSLQFLEEVADEMKVFEMIYSDKSNTIKMQAQSGQHDDTIAAIGMAHLHLHRIIPQGNFLSSFGFA